MSRPSRTCSTPTARAIWSAFLHCYIPTLNGSLPIGLGVACATGGSLRDYMQLLDEHAASSTLKEVVELAHQTVTRSEGGATSRDTSTRVGGVEFHGFSLVGF